MGLIYLFTAIADTVVVEARAELVLRFPDIVHLSFYCMLCRLSGIGGGGVVAGGLLGE